MTVKKKDDQTKNERSKFISSKIMLGVSILLLVLFSAIAFRTFTSPEHVNMVTYMNNIQQKTDYSYKIDVIPSSLYPYGGTITPEHRIFTKITENLIVSISSMIRAEKPVLVEGSYKIIIKLVAEDLWEKEYNIIISNQKINIEGTEISLINDAVRIPIHDILEYTQIMEQELGYSSDRYLISINPIIEGTIKAGNKSNPIASPPELTFSLTSRDISLIGEKSFVNDNPVQETEVLVSDYNFMGFSIPLSIARLVSFILTLGPLTYISLYTVNALRNQKENIYESVAIDLKYKNRLINLKRSFDYSDKYILIVDDFKSLVRIADEKELPILRFEASAVSVNYFVINGQCIYSYQCDNTSQINHSNAEEQTTYVEKKFSETI
ncbi:MAG: DUF5305 domain-containing protein [Clostridiales bacterium]|nr:DUF5305 domain-containing protein [Clostridiales bacterium]